MHKQVAGLVVPGARNSAAVEPAFSVGGNERIANRELSKAFFRELKTLCAKANFGGTFTLTVISAGKGSTHRKGLHIGSPNARHGVDLSWQERGNDSCVQMVLSSPPNMQARDFHSKLKAAEAALLEDDEDNLPPADPLQISDITGGKHRETVINFPDTGRQPDQAAATTVPGLDETDVELFMREACSYVNNVGHIARNVCEVLLAANYSVVEPAKVLDAMMSCEHLSKVDEAHLRIGQRWAKLIDSSVKASTEASAAMFGKAPSHKDAFDEAAEKAAAAAGLRFVEDESAIEAFLRRCLPSVTPTGLLLRSICSDVLKKHHGYVRTGAVTESLVMRGHLEAIEQDEYHYRVSSRWLEKLRPPSGAAVDATVAAQDQEASVKSPALSGNGKTASGTLDAIADLQRRAKVARTLRARLTEVDGEIENLTSLLQKAQERRERIDSSLRRPDMLEAEEQLRQVELVLKLKL